MSGNTTYVAGFVQGAVDDTNTLGAFCKSPGKPDDGLPSVAKPAARVPAQARIYGGCV
ncbi:hypothetical protein B0H14DRAFT_3430855 [Mycena olivaceomarginata]|nr:hypothetical protein B0H14DRAFT_3430855 [Mycena olivaceomarginata]